MAESDKKADRNFLAAVAMGNRALAIGALGSGASIDAVDDAGRGALHKAVEAKDHHLCLTLLSRGASIGLPAGDRGRQPLHIAMLTNEPRMAKMLLEAGADPNALTKDGRSPMHELIESQQLEERALAMARQLITSAQGRLDTGLRDGAGASALHAAALCGWVDLCCALLDAGWEIGAKDGAGQDCFQILAQSPASQGVGALLAWQSGRERGILARELATRRGLPPRSL